MRASIAILTHLQQGLSPQSFLGTILAESWLPEGRQVVAHQGLRQAPAADLGILHVDLTVVPPAYRQLGESYPRCLNLACTDIAKRRISRELLRPDDAYDGPVIVKTDLNHGGIPERHLALASKGSWERLRQAALRRLPAAWTGRLPQDRYLVFARKSRVPSWVWRSRGLVVERFHAERRGDLYAMHMCFFLGDRGVVATTLSESPLVKGETARERLPLHEEVPEAIRQRRRELGFDYGKFDYVLADGVPIVLDANRTPHASSVSGLSERGKEICRRLAPGIDWFFRR